MEYSLEAATRKIVGKQVKSVRANGFTPAVLYGKGIASRSLQVNAKNFAKIYNEAGSASLVTLKIEDEKPIKILIKEPQHHHINLEPVHVDFYQVNMKEKIRTEIPLEFIGESPAVTELDGKLVTSLDAIEVECLPDDLVPHFDVDLSVLKEFDDAIHVSDLKIPESIELLTEPELTIVVVQAPLTEEQLEAELAEDQTEEEAVAAVEVEEKAEGEEGAEGEVVAPTEAEKSE